MYSVRVICVPFLLEKSGPRRRIIKGTCAMCLSAYVMCVRATMGRAWNNKPRLLLTVFRGNGRAGIVSRYLLSNPSRTKICEPNVQFCAMVRIRKQANKPFAFVHDAAVQRRHFQRSAMWHVYLCIPLNRRTRRIQATI